MIQVNSSYVPKDNVKVLVSGGVDSIAAVHWLKHHYRLNFEIVHFNHRVQPINYRMSDSVSSFNAFEMGGIHIHNRCRKPFYYPAFADTSENGLRLWRWWEMEGIGGNFITAHHLDDACENAVMSFMKGEGEYLPIPWDTHTGRGFHIYHPFLRTTKDDFIQYTKDNDLMKYVVEDPSNQDNTNLRNHIRNVILPEMNTRTNMRSVIRRKFYIN